MMRTKFILLKFAPFAVFVLLFVFLIDNNLSYETNVSGESALNESTFEAHSSTDGEFNTEDVGIGEPIISALNTFGNLFKTKAYSEDKVNFTRLYQSLHLATDNLELSAHMCESNSNAKGANQILIGLISQVDSFDRRNIIRETLAKQVSASNQKLLFFVAESVNETVNDLVMDEMMIHQDLVRLEFIEDYYNLTLKSIGFLEYFNSYCSNYRYAMKLDDDVAINWFGLQKFLSSQTSDDKATIYCRIHRRARVIRDISNKWHLDKTIYSDIYYPDYCAGPTYVFNRKAAQKVLQQHEKMKTKIIAFEDVYLTGICTHRTHIQMVPKIKNLLQPTDKNKEFLIQNYMVQDYHAMHSLNDSEYLKLYTQIDEMYNIQ